MNNQHSNDHLKDFFEATGRIGKRVARHFIHRAKIALGRKIISSGIKAILIKTAPIWGAVLLFLFIGYIAFTLIYAIPRMAAEEANGMIGTPEQVAAFFGLSEEDAKGYEDIFQTYQEIASRWDEGLDEHQKEQVQIYQFSWAVLAGVDRMRNDPYIKKKENTESIYINGKEIKVEAIKPPANFIPIYKGAAKKYGVDWEVLASIHKNESTYSTYPVGGVSSAGAKGPMQFMPSTFASYGVDGNGDGKIDIWNDEDAIYSAANYLSKSGYSRDVRKALYAYNHANWYVEMILKDAEAIHHLTNESTEVTNVPEEQQTKNEGIVYKFINLLTSPKLITPRPEETFEALRPRFKWKDSVVTTRWTEEECETDAEGNEVCTTVEKETKETIKLLVQADTYEGTYIHEYEWRTYDTNDGKEVTREMNIRVIPPSPEEFMKPFYDYLKENRIEKQIDIDTTMELIAIYDNMFATNQSLRGALNYNFYPDIEHIQGANGWIWPTVSKRITSGFGPRVSPCAGCSSYHEGVDIGAVQRGVAGDPVFAMADGVVEASTYHNRAGNYININHGNGVLSRYLHLSKSFVKVGQKVKKGDLIGLMGKTGSGNGVHLDFRISINGKYYDPLYFFR
ncbi:peptidoglycan DD-metalloendopeptidase family protein [Calidifontibacillus erzurumensis]|uniref:peptidoglycan DD-metalloendopeptidase family protein n=1 Tax=Calidifontibacillus erzurumensis TaxID=2741433 RepID=UPI0035B567A9